MSFAVGCRSDRRRDGDSKKKISSGQLILLPLPLAHLPGFMLSESDEVPKELGSGEQGVATHVLDL